ncbi:MAG: fucose isomerase [Kiritimatiellae bacterium]|nr:fucose isomerase [Kiritimatiellia bacterium]
MQNGIGFGVIVGTRGFFSAKLAKEGRRQILAKLDALGYKSVILPEGATPTGAVETVDDARKCAALFHEKRAEIAGVIVTLPNFGDELGVVNTLKFAGLDVPVLVQACDDDLDKVDVDNRRDSFCGKLSVCNNLVQYGIPFTNTRLHTCALNSDTFADDVTFFAGVCRVVRGLRNARIGAIGTRPAAFQTMRISEKLLQRSGITVVTVDMSEIIGAASKLDAAAKEVKAKIAEIRAYGTIPAGIPDENVARQARLSVAVGNWIRENAIDAAGLQCWTSIQQNYGCAACLTMSMLGEALTPCACEVDVGGVTGMYALTLATGNPAALLDWNNNYGDDRNMCVCTHCSSYPKSFINNPIEISNLDVLGAALGPENCFGGVKGKVAAGPMTYLRVSTDDTNGRVRAYLGEGEFTDDPFDMAGGIAVCRIPNLQALLAYLCEKGFEHHVGMTRSHCAAVIAEAVQRYLKWDLYRHR